MTGAVSADRLRVMDIVTTKPREVNDDPRQGSRGRGDRAERRPARAVRQPDGQAGRRPVGRGAGVRGEGERQGPTERPPAGGAGTGGDDAVCGGDRGQRRGDPGRSAQVPAGGGLTAEASGRRGPAARLRVVTSRLSSDYHFPFIFLWLIALLRL